MNTNELQNNDNQFDQLTDLEPNGEVVGGTDTGALVNVSGTNTWERATTNNQGRLIVGVDSVKL